jgi:hypothetical protein
MVTIIVYTVTGSRPVHDGTFFYPLLSGVEGGGDNN